MEFKIIKQDGHYKIKRENTECATCGKLITGDDISAPIPNEEHQIKWYCLDCTIPALMKRGGVKKG